MGQKLGALAWGGDNEDNEDGQEGRDGRGLGRTPGLGGLSALGLGGRPLWFPGRSGEECGFGGAVCQDVQVETLADSERWGLVWGRGHNWH